MPSRCICDRSPESHAYHGKKRYGTLNTHRGAVHNNPKCPHSELRKTTKRFRRRKIRAVPGTRKLIAIHIDEPKRQKR